MASGLVIPPPGGLHLPPGEVIGQLEAKVEEQQQWLRKLIAEIERLRKVNDGLARALAAKDGEAGLGRKARREKERRDRRVATRAAKEEAEAAAIAEIPESDALVWFPEQPTEGARAAREEETA